MIPNPIHKVLSTLSCHGVRHLLMGGQACVLYGAAEFSRDCNVVILAAADNFDRLRAALAELQAECIALPPFEPDYLERGHAIHFRCQHPDAKDIRLDVMTKLRGCDDFGTLWDRRSTVELDSSTSYDVLAVEDLVLAKKTQRDKDWPMIRRLVDAHFQEYHLQPTQDQIRFWLRESRSLDVLSELAHSHPNIRDEVLLERPLLQAATTNDQAALEEALTQEEKYIRAEDQAYWLPLKQELEELRRKKRSS